MSHFEGAVLAGMVIGIPIGWLLLGLAQRFFRT